MNARQYTIGHRGAAGLAPENTLESFRFGCESKAAAVECDVQLSKDQQLVVIHDETLDRTTNGHGLVSEKTAQEIMSCEVKGGGHVPLLTDVVQLVGGFGKILMIEVKAETAEDARATCSATLSWVREHGNPDIEIHSFWLEVVKAASEAGVKTAFIVSSFTSIDDLMITAKKLGAYSVNILHEKVTEEFVKSLHANDLEVSAWTLNTEETFNRMKMLGVNGLITNFPDRFTV